MQAEATHKQEPNSPKVHFHISLLPSRRQTDSTLYYNTRNSVADERLIFVLRVKKLLVANLGTETSYIYTGLPWFPHSSLTNTGICPASAAFLTFSNQGVNKMNLDRVIYRVLRFPPALITPAVLPPHISPPTLHTPSTGQSQSKTKTISIIHYYCRL
jgi:hypothetical protein